MMRPRPSPCFAKKRRQRPRSSSVLSGELSSMNIGLFSIFWAVDQAIASALEELDEVHLRLGGEHSLRYLLRGHFKAEYEDGDVLLARGVLPDVEREGRLSHSGTRSDDVERAGL